MRPNEQNPSHVKEKGAAAESRNGQAEAEFKNILNFNARQEGMFSGS